MKIFQERLILCRKKLNKTQAEVAKEIGFTLRTYCRYELGETSPTLVPLVKMADYFDVSLDYLTGRTLDPTPPAAPGASPENQPSSEP